MITKKKKSVFTAIASLVMATSLTLGVVSLGVKPFAIADSKVETTMVSLTDNFKLPDTPKMNVYSKDTATHTWYNNATATTLTNEIVYYRAGSMHNLATYNGVNHVEANKEKNPGMLVTTTTSGVEANGSKVNLGTYKGDFSMSFRVFSTETFEGQARKAGTGYSQTSLFDPYADVQELRLRFTSVSSGRYFEVVMKAGELYSASGVEAGVQTDKMSVPKGAFCTNTYSHKLGAVSTQTSNINDMYSGYACEIPMSSFSNVSNRGRTFYSGSTSPIVINFGEISQDDGSTQSVVYVDTGKASTEAYKYVPILAVTSEKNTGAGNTIPVDFIDNDYTVEAIFSKMTDNDTPVSVNGKWKSYDRYGKMLIYAINEKAVTSSDIPSFSTNDAMPETQTAGTIKLPEATIKGVKANATITYPNGQSKSVDNYNVNLTACGEYSVKYTATVGETEYSSTYTFTLIPSYISNLNGVTAKIGSAGNVSKTYQSGRYDYRQGPWLDSYMDIDGAEDGLVIKSTKSGTEANGASFQLGGTYNGKFSIDFNVYSLLSHMGYDNINGERSVANLNPFVDVEKVSLVFTDKDTGKNFTIVVAGYEAYDNNSVTIGVKTGNMANALGYYTNNDTITGYNTKIRSSSFSNVAGNMTDNTAIKPLRLCFDPSTMEVYTENVFVDGKSGIQAHQTVLYLNKVEDVLDSVFKADGYLQSKTQNANNVINSFGNYTVSVEFTKVTPNDTKVSAVNSSSEALPVNYSTSSAGVTYVTETTYDRYAKMVIYSVCDQKIGANEEDTTVPTVTATNKTANVNETVDLTPMVMDNYDGEVPYNGVVKYSLNGGEQTVIEATDGKYLFTPTMAGEYTITYGSIKDSSNNASKEVSATLSVKSGLYAASLSLESNIKVNFYLTFDATTLSDETATVTLSCDGYENISTLVKDMTVNGGYYVASFPVAVKDANKDVTVKVTTSEGEIINYSYSVATYIENMGGESELKDLLESLNAYADYANAYFNGEEVSDEVDLSNVTFEENVATVNGTQEGVTLYGATLVLESDTLVRIYFKSSQEVVNSLVCTVDGNATTVKYDEVNKLYYIEKAVAAKDLANNVTFVIGDMSVSYGAFTYAYSNVDTSDIGLINLLKVMKLYNECAIAYFN